MVLAFFTTNTLHTDVTVLEYQNVNAATSIHDIRYYRTRLFTFLCIHPLVDYGSEVLATGVKYWDKQGGEDVCAQ